jgi:outer membrane autotransporter protein
MNRSAIRNLCSLAMVPAAFLGTQKAGSQVLPPQISQSFCQSSTTLSAADLAACAAAGYGGQATPAPLSPPQATPSSPAGLDALTAPSLVSTTEDIRHRLDAGRGRARTLRAGTPVASQGFQWQFGNDADRIAQDPAPGLSDFALRANTVSVGADRRLGESWAVGGSMALTRTHIAFSGNQSRQKASSDNVTLYGLWSPASAASATLSASHERTSFRVQRDGGLGQIAGSTPQGSGSGLALSAGYDFMLGAWSISPFVQADRILTRVGAFEESGSNDASAVDSQKLRSSTLNAGFNIQFSTAQSWGLLLPYARVELSQRQDRMGGESRGRLLADGTALLIPTPAEGDRRYGSVALGITAVTQRALSAFVDIQSGFGHSGYRVQRLGLGLRYEL